MKVSQILNFAVLCGFAVASPLPGDALAKRDAEPADAGVYGIEKREPQNTYGRAYTLKMKDDGFKKRDPQNTYGKAYTLKMKDDGFEKRQNTYGKAYTLKMKDDGFEKRDIDGEV
ncbi:hypothetical protein FSARC_10740 [Fusarium sarcochroum]|uniref:Uncharacterized protein n=1 Tax=Fusarium sarcochroum TaxID=1208366 RepID=A0A8H4TK64_9HYPO|nr:hypothetical protein FSARC_10740 [Fusarium sarcochroum]